MEEYISKSKLNFRCSFSGTCSGTEEECKKCGDYVCSFEDIQRQPTVSETEIIRKAFERVVQRAEKEYDVTNWDRPWAITINRLKDIVKEECGIIE